MSLPLLYSGTKNASSWAMRAWLALREADVEFEEVVVDIRRPLRYPNLRAVSRISPSGTVPLLVASGAVIYDSLAIMEFANDCCDGKLLPADPIVRAKARSVMAWQHAGLSQICPAISFESAFYPFKRPLTGQERKESDRVFDHFEDTLFASGGPFLFGALSLADLVLVPTVIRLTRHNIDLTQHPLSRQWVETVLNLESVGEWMAVANDLPHIWFDEYLAGDVPLDWDASAPLPGHELAFLGKVARSAGEVLPVKEYAR